MTWVGICYFPGGFVTKKNTHPHRASFLQIFRWQAWRPTGCDAQVLNEWRLEGVKRRFTKLRTSFLHGNLSHQIYIYKYYILYLYIYIYIYSISGFQQKVASSGNNHRCYPWEKVQIIDSKVKAIVGDMLVPRYQSQSQKSQLQNQESMVLVNFRFLTTSTSEDCS